MSNNITATVSNYLKNYADAPLGKHPTPSPESVDLLRQSPEDSFKVIANHSFQRPENLDPRDLDVPLVYLLATIADLVPDLIIPRMATGFWGARYLYVQGAASSKSPIFIPILISLLTDRSIYIKTLLLRLIIECSHLQVPEARPKLEKLSRMKSFQNSDMDQELLEQAKQSISSSNSLRGSIELHFH